MTDNEDTIKLVIADDHTLFRDALIEYIKRSNLNAELVVLKSFDEAYEYLETDNEQDLVILDLRMPGMNGLQGFKTLKEKYPEPITKFVYKPPLVSIFVLPELSTLKFI